MKNECSFALLYEEFYFIYDGAEPSMSYTPEKAFP